MEEKKREGEGAAIIKRENGVRDARPIQVHWSGMYYTFNYAKIVMYFPLVYSSLPVDCRP